jgi:hypothetical protein
MIFDLPKTTRPLTPSKSSYNATAKAHPLEKRPEKTPSPTILNRNSLPSSEAGKPQTVLFQTRQAENKP